MPGNEAAFVDHTKGDSKLEMFWYCKHGPLEKVDELLLKHSLEFFGDLLFRSPVQIASLNGHLDIVQRLVNAGADWKSRDASGQTCFMMASSNGHVHVATYLFELGAKVDDFDYIDDDHTGDELTIFSTVWISNHREMLSKLMYWNIKLGLTGVPDDSEIRSYGVRVDDGICGPHEEKRRPPINYEEYMSIKAKVLERINKEKEEEHKMY